MFGIEHLKGYYFSKPIGEREKQDIPPHIRIWDFFLSFLKHMIGRAYVFYVYIIF